MPRIKKLFTLAFFCHQCKVVVPITYPAACEIAKHRGHKCEYAVIKP